MCGRYSSTLDPATLAVEFDAVDATDGAAPGPDHNVAPTKPVLAVVTRHPRDDDGTPDPSTTVRSVRVMRWGLVPHWAKDPSVGSRMINARSETAADKPAFAKPLATRRCLLPADGWYEWRRGATTAKTPKQPFFLTRADGGSMAFAGLWTVWHGGDAPLVTCTVLTTDAVGPLADVHDRMPLVLAPGDWASWLDPDSADVSALLAPPSAELVAGLELRPVSTAVNNVRNSGPSLTERVEPEQVDQPPLLDLDGFAATGATTDPAPSSRR